MKISYTKEVNVGSVVIGGNNPFVLIAGPCVIENEKSTFENAARLKDITSELGIPFIFKASYDKANRSSLDSYRGPGLKRGIQVLAKIKKKLNIPVTSDVHSVGEVKDAKDVLDVIQIPAFLCRQTDLVLSAASTKLPVNIKKGQFLSPRDIGNIISKIESASNRMIVITERGVSFGYNNLVSDLRSIPIMRDFGYPVCYDATHSVQRPGGLGNKSGGDSRFVPYLAGAAVTCGADAVFLEVHENPKAALSDGPNMLKISELSGLLKRLKKLEDVDRL